MKTSTFVWSLVWAIAIVASAFLFNGNAEYWIESALVVGALVFVILRKRPTQA
jgi:hypothetical protein